MATVSWSLPVNARNELVKRTGVNLYCLAFSELVDLTESIAAEAAKQLEQTAYVAAQAQSTTTTGARPDAESKRIYLRYAYPDGDQATDWELFTSRRLSELVVEFVLNYRTEPRTNGASVAAEGVFDLSGGSRDFLSKESAERHFEPLLKDAPPPIHTVILSTKSFGVEAAGVAQKALSTVTSSLRTANLSDIIGGRPEAEALEVLKTLGAALAAASLTEINLSNNALGEKGLRACQTLFTSQPHLEIVSLHNIGCSPDACAALNQLTADIQLKGLYLYNNMSGDEGGSIIGGMLNRMKSMEHFQMASSRVGASGMLNLAAGLCSAKNLQSLDVNDNPATAESISGIVKLLSSQSALKRLNLSDTSLGDDGISELSKALLTSASKLEVLELALNEITFEGATVLSQAIAAKAHLKKLDLHENELEDQGTLLIAKAIEAHTTLEELNLCGNMLHRCGAVAVARSLKMKPQFQLLSIDENQISAAGIDLMKGVLEELFKGHYVLGSLEENEDVEEEGAELNEINMDQSDLATLIEQLRALELSN